MLNFKYKNITIKIYFFINKYRILLRLLLEETHYILIPFR
jgi:hypothetical protein